MSLGVRFLKYALLWGSVAAVLLMSAGLSLAQNTTRVFYLARVDSNQDSVVTEADMAQLFSWDGQQPSAISPAGTCDVQMFEASTNIIAYVCGGETPSLFVKDMTSGASLGQALTSPVTQIAFHDDLVWVVTRTPDNLPQVVGYDPLTLTVKAQRAAKRDDTVLTIQGDWVFAYNPSGLINVFSLPSLDPVTVPLEDYSLSKPIWSPDQTQFQYLAASSAAPTDTFISVVDVANGTSRHIDVPDAASDAFLQTLWSSHGTYLVFQNSAEPETLRLIDAASGENTVLREPGYTLTPFVWSDNDLWFVYDAASVIDTSHELILYNVQTGQSTLLKNPAVQPILLSWSPDSTKLVALGQSNPQDEYGVFLLSDPSFDQWQVEISGDASLAEGGFLWLDTDHVLLTQDGTLVLLELPTGFVTPITDQTQQVIAQSVSQG